MSTIRERVKAIQAQLRSGTATPDIARDGLLVLTGLMGNCLQEYREAEALYKPVLLEKLREGGAANRARIEAECTDQYGAMRERKDTVKLVEEMIRSCKVYLKSLDTEMSLSR